MEAAEGGRTWAKSCAQHVKAQARADNAFKCTFTFSSYVTIGMPAVLYDDVEADVKTLAFEDLVGAALSNSSFPYGAPVSAMYTLGTSTVPRMLNTTAHFKSMISKIIEVRPVCRARVRPRACACVYLTRCVAFIFCVQELIDAVDISVFKVDLGAEEEALDVRKRSDASILKCWMWGVEGEQWFDCEDVVRNKQDARRASATALRRVSAADQKAESFKAAAKKTTNSGGLDAWADEYITEVAVDSERRSLYYKYYGMKANAAKFQMGLHRRRVRSRAQRVWRVA